MKLYEVLKDNLLREFIDNNLITDKLKTSKLHLAILNKEYLSLIMKGNKTMESRFSKHKIIPYQNINKNDIVIMKQSSGPILGLFTIKEVLFFDLKEVPITIIKDKYQQYILAEHSFWEEKKVSRYATLIVIDKIFTFQPFYVEKKGQQSWIILN